MKVRDTTTFFVNPDVNWNILSSDALFFASSNQVLVESNYSMKDY